MPASDALGLEPTADLARVRTILLELERMWSHLNDIAAVCAGVGLAAGNTSFAGFTERARRLNATLAGHRFLFGTVRVGGSALALDDSAVRAAREEIGALRSESSRAWRELLFNASFQDRLPAVGVVTSGRCREARCVRARGARIRVASTTSARSARSWPTTGLEPSVPKRAAGDVRARVEQRALELLQTFEILEDLLDRPIDRPPPSQTGRRARSASAGSRAHAGPPAASSSAAATASSVCTCAPARTPTGRSSRTPQPENLLPDFPLINKSFELCYACADR